MLEVPDEPPAVQPRARIETAGDDPRGMVEVAAEIAGTRVIMDSSGALFLPGSRTLIVSDLHLEKASSYARRGMMLPPYDTGATLLLLATLILKRDPKRIIALGDSFHDSDGFGRLREPDRALLFSLQAGCEWVWVSGNHDAALPPDVGGEIVDAIEIEGLTFRHEPVVGADAGEVAGHLHPSAKVRGRGRSVRCRAFATDGGRMVMPAFGVMTGGLNVLDSAFARLFSTALSRAILIGHGKLFPVAFPALSPD
jgi:DNA ligase-associated metallophosphoesterase